MKKLLGGALMMGIVVFASLSQAAPAEAKGGGNPNAGGGNPNAGGGNPNAGGPSGNPIEIPPHPCANSDVLLGGSAASACFGQVLGNDVGTSPTLLDLLNDPVAQPNFGDSTWTWLSAGTQIQEGSGTSGFLTSTSNSNLLSGNWTLTLGNNALIEALVISVKGGPGWSAYFFNPANLANSFSGTWTTLGLKNRGGNQPGISHISAYYVVGQQPPQPIPTPALVPAALGMSAALFRKKKQEAAQKA